MPSFMTERDFEYNFRLDSSSDHSDPIPTRNWILLSIWNSILIPIWMHSFATKDLNSIGGYSTSYLEFDSISSSNAFFR